ncbi:MAG TPA: hypothetical protein VGF45_08530 [Polyangia bacterium]
MNTTTNQNGSSRSSGTGKHAPGAIHYSLDEDFPIWRTPCGRVGPATNRWQYVTCDVCIELRPGFDEEDALMDGM